MKKRIKDYIVSWSYYIGSVYLIVGIDAMLKLRRGGFRVDTSGTIPGFHIVEKGLPKIVWIVATVSLFAVIGYVHLKILVIEKWQERKGIKRVMWIALFLINLCLCVQTYRIIYKDSTVESAKVHSRYETS